MAVYKRGGTCWYEFSFAGKRVRESATTTRKTIALEAERQRKLQLEKTLAGIPVEKRENRIRSVSDVVKDYIDGYGANHRGASAARVRWALGNVTDRIGNVLLPDLTENRIRAYMKTRLQEGVSGRTVNVELGELSRAIGKKWSFLWPRLKKCEERTVSARPCRTNRNGACWRQPTETARRTCGPWSGSQLTGLRAGELSRLTWGRVDLASRVVTVGDSKTEAGRGRQVPMNEDLYQVLCAHAEWFTGRFGETKPEYFVFPFGSPLPNNPTRLSVELKTAWESIRKAASVNCRQHDLRHTVCTKMAEAGVPESTMLAIMGHMSRAMLERYSHIRMAAKREAVEALRLSPVSHGVPTKVPTIGVSSKIQ